MKGRNFSTGALTTRDKHETVWGISLRIQLIPRDTEDSHNIHKLLFIPLIVPYYYSQDYNNSSIDHASLTGNEISHD